MPSWRQAVRELSRRGARVDDEQLALAKQIGLSIPRSIPALVAAVMIRERLSGPLRTEPPTLPTDNQAEFIADLAESLGMRAAPRLLETRLLASAWIEVLESRRAAKALRRLRPAAGDVIERVDMREESGVVVSVSLDGRINVAGPGGRGMPAHLAQIEVRAHDDSPEADHARRDARNRAASRARVSGPPSQAKTSVLAPYRIDESFGRSEAALLVSAIEHAEDERPIQKCLADHPNLFSSLTGPTSFGTFVRPQASLGGRYVPDFLLALADSAGLHWTLIELESPRAKAGIKNGGLADKAREAVQQIEDWREWLISNLDVARRPPAENGLGLFEIRPESPGIVLIGRRHDAGGVSTAIRRRLSEQRNIALHSYDWLLDAVGPKRGRSRPGGPLDWDDLLEFR